MLYSSCFYICDDKYLFSICSLYIQNGASACIKLDKLKAYLKIDDNLQQELRKLSNNNDDSIELDRLLYFIRYGKVIQISNKQSLSNKQNYNTNTNSDNDSLHNILSQVVKENLSPSYNHLNQHSNTITTSTTAPIDLNSTLPDLPETYHITDDTSEPIYIHPTPESINRAVLKLSTDTDNDNTIPRNVWRKSEKVKQERTVLYIAVDANGVKQVLLLLYYS